VRRTSANTLSATATTRIAIRGSRADRERGQPRTNRREASTIAVAVGNQRVERGNVYIDLGGNADTTACGKAVAEMVD